MAFNTASLIKNNTNELLTYIMGIDNPDLDYISFFEVCNDSILREIHTGELIDVSSREVYHRNFLFNIFIEPGSVYTYYLSINNNGHPCYIPLELKETVYFERDDSRTEIFNWFVYGLLIFIVVFNIYLYQAIKDKVNLYYALSLLFAILYFLHYEGYFYYLNPPNFFEKVKWINPSLYSVFLLLFTQSFSSNYDRFKILNKYINPLILLVLIAPFTYNLKHPFSFQRDIHLENQYILYMYQIQ